MGEEYDPPIILGRPLLNTTKVIIYNGTREVHFKFPSEKVRLHFNSNYIIEEDPKKNRSRRRRHTCHQKKKNIADRWANYEGEVSRFEDRYPDENTIKEEEPAEEEIVILDTLSSKSPSPTRQVWKPKVNSELWHRPMCPSISKRTRRSCSEDLKSPNAAPRGNLLFICIFLYAYLLLLISNCIYIFIAALEKKINMFCIASRKLLGPMYLICDATAHILIYCGGTKLIFRKFIFLPTHHK